ncbi:MAG: hypothetical protein ACKER6_01465 [Candidatus Hodgkinia cicadicola]
MLLINDFKTLIVSSLVIQFFIQINAIFKLLSFTSEIILSNVPLVLVIVKAIRMLPRCDKTSLSISVTGAISYAIH